MKAIETASIMIGMIMKIVYHRSDAVQTSAFAKGRILLAGHDAGDDEIGKVGWFED